MLDKANLHGIAPLARALNDYLREVEAYRETCVKHKDTAAVHDCSQSLEVYRMFPRSRKTADQLHSAVKMLPSWKESLYWNASGNKWVKLEKQVKTRVDKHTKQHHVSLRGVLWEELPMLVHAYKFDADRLFKVEIIVPSFVQLTPVLPICIMAKVLRCHEYLVPEHIAKPRFPYSRHDIKFLTIPQYLSRNTPEGLYARQCFPQTNGNVP